MKKSLDNIPQELLYNVLGYLDYRALGTMRLVWPSLDEPVLLPRLFSVIRLSFLEKHRRQFLGISSSPRLAPHVRVLRWHSLCHTEQFSSSLPRVLAFLSSDAIPNFRPLFLEGLDAMVNLRTFTTIMIDPSQSQGTLWREDMEYGGFNVTDEFSKLDLLQAFDNFLVPAMLGHGSKIESVRLLCKSLIMGDTRPESDLDCDPPTFFRGLIEAFRSLRVRLDSFALRNVKELDLCAAFPSATSSQFQRNELQAHMLDIVSAAKELRVLSLRSTDPDAELEPDIRDSTIFPGLHTLEFKQLSTLKLVNLVFSVKNFNEVLAKCAKTLQHILLYNCTGSETGLLEVVWFAAANSSINLHRFSVCVSKDIGLGPWEEGQTMAAQIIPEQEILAFINGEGVEDAVNPFLHHQPIGADDWQSPSERYGGQIDHYTDLWATAVESPERLAEWSQWGSLHYSCKVCQA
jgi:hypothetical protein